MFIRKLLSHPVQKILTWAISAAVILFLVYIGGHFIPHNHLKSPTLNSQTGNSTTSSNTTNPDSRKATRSSPSSKSSRPIISTNWRTIVPTDLKIGTLQLGNPLSDAIKTFGQPERKTLAHGLGTPEWVYPKGTYVEGYPVGAKGDPIWEIIVNSPSAGSTPRGIHVGSSVKAVQQAYPGIQKRTYPSGSFLAIDYDGKIFHLEFSIQDGVVSQISMDAPSP